MVPKLTFVFPGGGVVYLSTVARPRSYEVFQPPFYRPTSSIPGDTRDLHCPDWRYPKPPRHPHLARLWVGFNRLGTAPILKFGNLVFSSILKCKGFKRSSVPTHMGAVPVLRCEGKGQLPPIAVVLGIGGNMADYYKVLLQLRKDHRSVTVVDLPGERLEGTPERPICSRQVNRAARQALDQLIRPGHPVILLGHSLGAYYAARYAGKRQTNVLGTVLACPIGAPFDKNQLKGFNSLYSLDTLEKAKTIVHNAFYGDTKDNIFIARFAWSRLTSRVARQMFHSGAITTPLTPWDLARIKSPVMLIWGGRDHLLPSNHYDYFVNNLHPGTWVVRPPDVNHNNTALGPPSVMQPIRDFSKYLRNLPDPTLPPVPPKVLPRAVRMLYKL